MSRSYSRSCIYKYGHHLLALGGYLALTLLMTYPTLRYFGSAIPGDGFDGWDNLWNLWWLKQAYLVFRANPYYTQELFYPSGATLYFHTMNIFNGTTFLPVTLAANLFASYNAVVVFSFVAGGYGAYLLALHVGSRSGQEGDFRGAAFIAGIVFAFSPYHFAHLLGHMQLISLEWMPFYVLFMVRGMDALEGGRPSFGRLLRLAAMPALFLSLTWVCDWYYTMYLVIFTGMYMLRAMWRKRAFWPPLALALLTGLIFAAVFSPFLFKIVQDTLTADYMKPEAERYVQLSADLLAFVTPNEMHPLWGDKAAEWASRYPASTSERMVFAGYTAIALAAIALFKRPKTALFWGAAALVFVIFALGPVLHVGGHLTGIPMPYALLVKVPFLSLARSVSRYSIMAMLLLGVLASLGLGVVSSRARTPLVVPLAWVLLCFEFLPVPYPVSFPETHAFHYRLGEDPARYAIMDIPMDWPRPPTMLYQTVHRKPMVGGYIARENPLDLTYKTPILQLFHHHKLDIIRQEPARIAPTVLEDFGVRYVIVHKNFLPPGDYREKVLSLVEGTFGEWPIVFEDDWLRVYEAQPPDPPVPYITLGEGWGPPLPADDGSLTRAVTRDGATLLIHSRAGGDVSLVVDAWADKGAAGGVRVEVRPAGSFTVGPEGTRWQSAPIELPTDGTAAEVEIEPADTITVRTLDLAGPVE